MPYKFCPNCFSTSYSNSHHQIWLCPTCGKDISFMAETQDVCNPVGHAKGLEKPRHLRLIQGGKF